jgi:hypothetical protein
LDFIPCQVIAKGSTKQARPIDNTIIIGATPLDGTKDGISAITLYIVQPVV